MSLETSVMWDDRELENPLFSILAIALLTGVEIGIGIAIGWFLFS